jgi:CMP-N,N'-diacetyllegionaminic acid synthase
MINGKRVTSIIPARAGSKRIPGKNKLIFQDQSLIEWSIKSSIFCDLIDETILSTDDKDIIEIAKNYNVKLHSRSKSLSTDEASTFDLIKEIYFNFIDSNSDIIVLLQPTSPLREENLLKNNLIELSKNNEWSSSIEVFPIQYFTGKIKNNLWYPDIPESTRSQEIVKKYVPSGRFYAYDCKRTIEKDDALGHKVIPFFTEEWLNINIDNPIDIEKMKFIYSLLENKYIYLMR